MQATRDSTAANGRANRSDTLRKQGFFIFGIRLNDGFSGLVLNESVKYDTDWK